MSFDATEEARVSYIESTINQMLDWIFGKASKAQLRQLLLVRQTEIDTLTTRVTALESQIIILQNQFKNL
jgi:polyhydroxyalkanoate synthesis regulator phasin